MALPLWDPERRLQDLEFAVRLLLARLPASDPQVAAAIAGTVETLRATGQVDLARLLAAPEKPPHDQ